MKKKLLLLFIAILLICSCHQKSNAKNLFDQVCESIEVANISEWGNDSIEKKDILDRLDSIIEIEPDWWMPYRQKIEILKTGSCGDSAESVKKIYDLWIQNDNILEGFNKFSYACSFYCSGEEDKAEEIFQSLYAEYSQKENNEEGKIIYIFCGIILGEITEENLRSCVLELFEEKMISNIEEFYDLYIKFPKEVLWSYV